MVQEARRDTQISSRGFDMLAYCTVMFPFALNINHHALIRLSCMS
jgi:hypothetical protein